MFNKSERINATTYRKKIVVLGPAARGGMKTVIDTYATSGFYSPGHSVFLASHREGGVLLRSWVALQALIYMFWMLLTQKVELSHLHMATKGSFWRKSIFVLICRLFGVPTVIHLHGGRFTVFYEDSAKWIRYLIRHVFDRADAIIVLSQYWFDFVKPLTRTPVRVINNFVPDHLDTVITKFERHPRHVLFLGQIGVNKGIYDLLPVFSDIVRRFPDAKLVCGGDGEVNKVCSKIVELGATDVIDVPGWVSGPGKEELMYRCSIFVLPSYNEGLPMAIIEAMSYSMVVVSTRVGGIPELVDESNGFLITPGNQDELRAALIKLFEKDEQAISVMGAASREKYLKSFAPEACLSEMRSLYLSLGVTP
ncbi:MAG: glycosyltransferase family 4 protein [Candidatus Thiodiazotropha sp. (ex Lucinoma borealis)]|nr:glycosyltransferase family 4 protein [Candidatus Thiodiazotropha sp. (ex Lucinoma borealis)]MCU7867948.1 glycosyltransferase family 4 protein [Candidatus Thiodiazotropha sp. (ex Lucinoma borealis)]